jgi:hypothetical protein
MGRKSREKQARRAAKANEWGEFYECDIPVEAYPPGQAPGLIFVNLKYTVAIWKHRGQPGSGIPNVIHLSIKRNDREVIHDWRDLQRIKNELIGPEYEAAELYPAEDRLVDCANQYHLYIMADAEMKPLRFPFGFQERLVSDDTSKTGIFAKSKQRPFEKPPEDNAKASDIEQKWKELVENPDERTTPTTD